jgi:hypothetical protein
VSGAAGAVGGCITGGIIQAATGSGLDFGQILAQVAGGGAVVAALVGLATKSKASDIR